MLVEINGICCELVIDCFAKKVKGKKSYRSLGEKYKHPSVKKVTLWYDLLKIVRQVGGDYSSIRIFNASDQVFSMVFRSDNKIFVIRPKKGGKQAIECWVSPTQVASALGLNIIG